MEQMGIHCLWVHRSAERDRRPGDIGATAVSSEPVQQYAVPVPRLPAGPDQGAVLGGRSLLHISGPTRQGLISQSGFHLKKKKSIFPNGQRTM